MDIGVSFANLSVNVLIDSSFFCFVAMRVGTDISVSSSKNEKASRDLHVPFKGNPLEGADE